MADTPVVRAETWLKQHERIVILFLVLAAALFIGNKYIDSSAVKAQAQASVAEQLAADARLSASQAAAQAALTQAQYQDMVTALTQQNATLAQAVTQRDAILGKQQTAVQTAPLNDVAAQWQAVIGGSSDIAVVPTGLSVSESGARKTLTQLLELPVVKADLSDQREITKNVKAELSASVKAGDAKDAQISALNAENTTQIAASKAEVKAVKAEAKKNSVKWFKRGFIVGFVAGLWAGHAAGL